MKIGKPTKNVPRNGRGLGSNSKYQAVWEAVERIKNGDWLPIIFDNATNARRFRTCCTLVRFKLDARMRGLVVYVRQRTP